MRNPRWSPATRAPWSTRSSRSTEMAAARPPSARSDAPAQRASCPSRSRWSGRKSTRRSSPGITTRSARPRPGLRLNPPDLDPSGWPRWPARRRSARAGRRRFVTPPIPARPGDRHARFIALSRSRSAILDAMDGVTPSAGSGPGSGPSLGRADLHVHSWWSDGAQSPEDLVRAAAGRVDVLAITDHDEIAGALQAASSPAITRTWAWTSWLAKRSARWRVCSPRCRIARRRQARAEATAAMLARLHTENATLRQRVAELERLVRTPQSAASGR